MRIITKALLAAAAVVSFGSMAQAADLLAPIAPIAPVAPAPVSWDGAYVGANIGYGWGSADYPGGSIDQDGLIVGGQIGYNFYLSDGVVLGIQGDMDWADIDGTDAFGINSNTDWIGAVTGHIGFAFDSVMPYVLGGVAFAHNTVNAPAGSDSQTHTGYTVGAGVEFMLADSISAFAEYRYADYGSQTYTIGGVPGSISLTDNSVRAGLNFHF